MVLWMGNEALITFSSPRELVIPSALIRCLLRLMTHWNGFAGSINSHYVPSEPCRAEEA